MHADVTSPLPSVVSLTKLTLLSFLSLFIAACASLDTQPFAGDQLLATPLGSAAGCSLSATSPPSANANGRVRLSARSFSRSIYSDLFTGRSYTVASLLRELSSAFGRAGSSAAGAPLFTLGSLDHGGEARLSSLGGGAVRIQYAGNSTGTIDFSGSEVGTLKQLIDQALAQP